MKRNSFRGSFIRIMTGGVVAQALSLIASPIISRLYSPSEIGYFGVYSAYIAIFSIVATFRLEDLIVIEAEAENVNTISEIGVCAALVVALITIPVTFFSEIFRTNEITITLMTPGVFFAVVIAGWYQLVISWMLRMKQYELLAKNTIFKNFASAGMKIALGMVGVNFGMMFAQIFADCCTLFYASKSSASKFKIKLLANKKIATQLIIKNRQYIIYGTLQLLLGVMWLQLPIILIGAKYGQEYSGYYVMGLILVQAPVLVFQNSLRQMLLKIGADAINKKEKIFKRHLKVTFLAYAIYIIPCILLVIKGDYLAELIFGERWRVAGDVAEIMAMSTMISMGKIPAMVLMKLFNSQNKMFYYDGLAFFIEIYLFTVIANNISFGDVLVYHSCVLAIYNTISIGWMMRKAFLYDTKLSA